jgi:hypothetical protein
MKLEEIRLGDVVRLRNGETIRVRGKSTSYHDSRGEHVGPFVSGPTHADRYLLADVVDVAVRNEKVCAICEREGVTSTNPDVDFCERCFYSGAAIERERGELLYALRALDGVETADVWHTGGGCFLLAVKATDGRLITVSDEAAVPEPGEPWKTFVISESEDVFDDYDPDRMEERDGEWSDEALVDEVRKVVS